MMYERIDPSDEGVYSIEIPDLGLRGIPKNSGRKHVKKLSKSLCSRWAGLVLIPTLVRCFEQVPLLMQIRALRARLGFMALGVLGPLTIVATTSGDESAALSGALDDRKPSAPIVGPRLQVPNPVHDFGTVKQGEVVRHDFKLVNTGDRALEITEVKRSCGCTTAGD